VAIPKFGQYTKNLPKGVHSASTHPEILIKARIARKLSERQLAERIGATARQIREWEDNDYGGVAASRIGAIARAFDINAPRRPFFTTAAAAGRYSQPAHLRHFDGLKTEPEKLCFLEIAAAIWHEECCARHAKLRAVF
jgi:transcriptional regulator with XRE-family HTH domain